MPSNNELDGILTGHLSPEAAAVMGHYRGAVHEAHEGALVEVFGALATDSDRLTEARRQFCALLSFVRDRFRADFATDEAFNDFIEQIIASTSVFSPKRDVDNSRNVV